MNAKMSLLVLAHGAGLIVLALFANLLSPETARVTFITGLAAGGMCALFGILGLLGFRGRAGAVLTLIAITLVLITQAVGGWIDQALGKSGNMLALVVMTVMLVVSIGLLAYVLHKGGNVQQGGRF